MMTVCPTTIQRVDPTKIGTVVLSAAGVTKSTVVAVKEFRPFVPLDPGTPSTPGI
jgi:hypothetical protein